MARKQSNWQVIVDLGPTIAEQWEFASAGTTGPSATSEDIFPDLGNSPVIDAGRLSTVIGTPAVLDDPAFARIPASADPAAIFAVLDVAS